MDPRLLEAQGLLRQGQPQLAEIVCRQLLAEQPRHAAALALLGAIAAHKGDLDGAVSLMSRSLAVDPAQAQTQFRLGVLHQELGDGAKALACFDHALDLQPGAAAILNLRGLALKGLGRMAEALASYEAALARQPDFVEALNNRAAALKHLGRLEEAVAGYRQALALRPESPELHNNLGFALQSAGRHEEALTCYDNALARRPGYVEALNNRGMALHELGRHEEAAACYRRVLEVDPEACATWMNLGVTLYEQYRFADALAMLDRALALRPGDLDVQFNRANVLLEVDRFEEAMALYEQVRAQRADDVPLMMNVGNALRDQHRFDEALAAYDEALALRPEDPGVRWNRSLCLLTQGDFARGWAEYEWRWKAGKLGNPERRVDAPKWLGREDLRGKILLVHSEQGLGDSLLMCRYVRVLAAMGARVVLQVQRPLVDLLQRVEGAAVVIAQGVDPGPIDFHCPMLSLLLALRTLRESIPSPQGSLSPDPALVEQWRGVIGEGRALNVGLVWAGNPGYAGDHRRSFELSRFRAALPSGLRYWCLHKDVAPADAPWLDADPPIARFERNEFTHTAAQISALDLVIGADTSVTHLAATLGTPTWILLPFTADFRWATDAQASPWYPGARLFRQTRPGDWDPVLAEVKSALGALDGPC